MGPRDRGLCMNALNGLRHMRGCIVTLRSPILMAHDSRDTRIMQRRYGCALITCDIFPCRWRKTCNEIHLEALDCIIRSKENKHGGGGLPHIVKAIDNMGSNRFFVFDGSSITRNNQFNHRGPQAKPRLQYHFLRF